MQKNWINKINEYHTTPPKAAWDNIACELDKEDESLDAIKLKLLAYETTAPVIVFKNIFEQLDKDDSKIHPVEKNKQNRSVIFMRMAVAASVITIALLLFFNNKKTAEIEKAVVTAPVNQPAIKQPEPGIAPSGNSPAPDDNNKKNDGQKIAAIPVQKTNPLQAAVSYKQPKDDVIEALAVRPEIIQQLMPISNTLINALNRYITITGPGGESVKLSSKFGNLAAVINNSNIDSQRNTEGIINSKWNEVFAGWRDKMANKVITPSLINFLNIIELSEFLEEKKPTIPRLDLYYLNLY